MEPALNAISFTHIVGTRQRVAARGADLRPLSHLPA